jgi:hypothetical protein
MMSLSGKCPDIAGSGLSTCRFPAAGGQASTESRGRQLSLKSPGNRESTFALPVMSLEVDVNPRADVQEVPEEASIFDEQADTSVTREAAIGARM